MKKSEELFILIKSLSKNEKRYFKLFCKQLSDKKSNYLRLFQAIEKQKTYNEQAILKTFQGETFIKQLHVSKNYLRNLLLKSLRNYHSQFSKQAQIKDLLRNVEILFQRELYPLCKQELVKAKKVALQYELDASLIEILSWERKVVQALYPSNFSAVAEVIKGQESAALRILEEARYWNLTIDITRSWGTGKYTQPEKIKLLENDEHISTLQSRVLYFHSLYYIHIEKGNSKEAGQMLKSLIHVLEERPDLLQEDSTVYISSINNYLSYLVFNKRFEEALSYIGKVKAHVSHLEEQGYNKPFLKQILRTYNIELELYKDQEAYLEVELVEIEQFITRENVPEEYLISFWFQLSSIYFGRKDYSQALTWINFLMQHKSTSQRLDLLIQARLLNLLIHFELQNFFALGYFIDSAKRFIARHASIYPYQKSLFSFLHSLQKLPQSEMRNEFKKLQHIFYESGEKNTLPEEAEDYINYRKWIEDNITKP